MHIDKAGVYDIPAREYHADPALDPSLSSSICKILDKSTPRHAQIAHPRLNPDYAEKRKLEFDQGTAAHALKLEGKSGVVVVDADSYRSKAAREARDAAYAAGKIPLLPHHSADVEAMVVAATAQLEAHEVGDVFKHGKPEQSLFWQEPPGIWCRARLDWLPQDFVAAGPQCFYDYKTTTTASPDAWQRVAFDVGVDIQDAFYRRGIKAALGISNPQMRFVVQEKTPPYALSVIALTPEAQALGDAKVHRCIAIWAQCLRDERWPGYPSDVCYIDAPVWKSMSHEAAKDRDQMVRDSGRDPIGSMIDWQAPL